MSGLSAFGISSKNPFMVTDLENKRVYEPGRTALATDRKGNLVIMTSSGEIPLSSRDRQFAKLVQKRFAAASLQAMINRSTAFDY